MIIKRGKKAQSAIELIIIIGAVLFFFVIFFAVIQSSSNDKNKEKERIVIQNIGLGIQDEIGLASGASEGYYREFQVPQDILGKDYILNMSENSIHLILPYVSTSVIISNVTGDIQKGLNKIRKENGKVYLN